jgi:transposase InsO family protein
LRQWAGVYQPAFSGVVHREGIELVHIQMGKPQQNGYVESFNGRLRDECLNVSWFANLWDARRKFIARQREYNEERPHSSLSYLTPAEYARQLLASQESACSDTKKPKSRTLRG